MRSLTYCYILYIVIFYITRCKSGLLNVLPSSSPVFDFILDNVDCPACDARIDNKDVSEVKIRVYNYENGCNELYSIAEAADAIMCRPDFNKTQNILMFVPGFNSDNGSYNDVLCYFSTVKYNGRRPLGLIVDHSAYTSGNIIKKIDVINLYKRAVSYTKSIGVQLGKFVIKLLTKVDRSRLDLCGHSLGAHMVGYIGDIVKEETGSKLMKIYGADPAGPCYNDCPEENFRSSQAITTVAFHCNSNEFGTKLRLSKYDFVSYDGELQQSCGLDVPELVLTFLQAKCSHFLCIPIMFNPDIFRNEGIWRGTLCSSADDYMNGRCEENESVQGGFRIVPNASPGVYYFTPSRKLTCHGDLTGLILPI